MSRPAKGRRPPSQGLPARSAPAAILGGTEFQLKNQLLERWLSLGVCLFLALAVWVVFGQTLHHEFVDYDDSGYVYNNPQVVRGLSLSGVAWAFTHTHGGNWHPLTSLSHMLDCQLYGLKPGGHHLTNVLFHAATSILLFIWLRKMTGTLWRSAFVAAVFAVHPLRVESVAWVAERKDVLSGLFFMLTIWSYARYTLNQSRLGYFLALGFFACGLLSKPMVVTLPFVLLLLDYWPLKRAVPPEQQISDPAARRASLLEQPTARIPALLLEKVPFFILSAAACVVALLSQQGAMGSLEHFDLQSRLANTLLAYAAYLGQMVYPVGLAVFYPHPGNQLSLGKAAFPALLLLLISAAVWVGRRRHPYSLVGWLWFLGMLVPVIGLVQVGAQARADRYTYLPQIGLIILVAWGALELCGSWRHRRIFLGSAAVGILAGLLAAAFVQTGCWANSVSLWTHALRCTRGNYLAHSSLGDALAQQGKLGEAVEEYGQAFLLQPNYAGAHINLGSVLARQQKLPEAIEQFERVLQLQPNSAEAHIDLGHALAIQGKLPESTEHFERALQLMPDSAEAHINLANAFSAAGKLNEAVDHFKRGLELNPRYAEARCSLGAALAAQGKVDEAIQQFEDELRLNPGSAKAHNNLGVALALQGKVSEAIPQFREALDLARAQNNVALAEAIQVRLRSYESPH